jgi:hypothetical protein
VLAVRATEQHGCGNKKGLVMNSVHVR